MLGTYSQRNIIVAAGMPRAGSTWLYRNLSLHPYANVSKLKEINYFSINYDRGIDWFESLYHDKSQNHARFDISPFYFLEPHLVNNIKKSGLNVKIIIILREPNSWIKSLYYQIKSYTLNMPPFAEFIKKHTINFDNRPRTVHLSEFDFLGRINELSAAFKNNLLLINFDLIKKDPTQLLNAIENFAGLPSFFNSSNIISSQINASQSEFHWLYFLSANRYLRSIANHLPFTKLIKYIQQKIYKEGQTNLAGISVKKQVSDENKYQLLANEKDIDEKFPPMFNESFFREKDIVYL